MKSFELITTSRVHYFISFFLVLAISIIALLELFATRANQFLFIASIICISFLALWIAGKFSKQTLIFTITSEYLSVDWIKLPLLSKKENRKIFWTEISTYVYQIERDFNLFKLTLTNREKLRFSISHDYQDDFKSFYQTFLEKIEELQKNQSDESTMTIKQGKTIYETWFGIGVAFLLAAGILFAIVYSLLNQDKQPVKWGKLIAAIGAGSYYIFLVWTYNMKNKSSA